MIIRNYNLKVPGVITTPFGGKTKDETVHPGLDIANKEGTQIPAFADGVVTYTGKTNNGGGNIVQMKDNNGNLHQYSHLRGFFKKTGETVKKGQPIASMGKTGNSYSPTGGDPSHLDIRIVTAYGKYKNPLTYLKNLK